MRCVFGIKMDPNAMHIQSNRQITNASYNQDQPNVIPSSTRTIIQSAKSNELKYFYERPMMLNTWTQTSDTDLGISDEYLQSIINEHREKEKALLEKIRVLETDLHVKSELISQMQSTYEPKCNDNTPKPSKLQRRSRQSSTKLTKALLQNHNQYTSATIQTYNTPSSTSSKDNTSTETNEQQQQPTQYLVGQEINIETSPMYQSHVSKSQNTLSFINNLRDTQEDNLNYTIISDVGGNADDEPIEIEIATEENTQNLNRSVDSERLEICLAEEQPYLLNTMPAISPNVAKRFKICTENRKHTPKPLEPMKTIKTELKPLQPLSTNHSTNESLLKQPVTVNKFVDKPKTVAIGPNNTRIPTEIFDAIDWEDPSAATRTLLLALFDRQTLATHSMTGRPSPAFKYTNKPIKEGLNQLTIKDIIFAVSHRCQVPDKVVRNFITTKCADETKMMKLAQAKLEQDKENVAKAGDNAKYT
ncbi:protein insensitive [Eurosta solidaginis]|uniref:protein insensitive n=1 Tax=Eurosta solidaginis TaxID=178769 RepID=UPI00353178D9